MPHGNFQSARLRLPFGQGIWPAFWMLGTDIGESGWPSCGEIDIMENRGDKPGWNASSLHGPGYGGDSPLTGQYDLPAGQEFNQVYHTFGVLWEPNSTTSFGDGRSYATQTAADILDKAWAFNHLFFFLANLAVGGHFSGLPDETTVFPQTLRVDYVRVYQAEEQRGS